YPHDGSFNGVECTSGKRYEIFYMIKSSLTTPSPASRRPPHERTSSLENNQTTVSNPHPFTAMVHPTPPPTALFRREPTPHPRKRSHLETPTDLHSPAQFSLTQQRDTRMDQRVSSCVHIITSLPLVKPS